MRKETYQTRLNDPAEAWKPFRPDRSNPWNLQKTAHLFRRAAFGADWNMLKKGLHDGPDETIEKLLKPPADAASFQSTYDGYEKSGIGNNSVIDGNAWWINRILRSPYPLLEKSTDIPRSPMQNSFLPI